MNYKVVNPLEEALDRALWVSSSVRDIALKAFSKPLANLIKVVFEVEGKASKPKIALLVDDMLQAIVLNDAEGYVKTYLTWSSIINKIREHSYYGG